MAKKEKGLSRAQIEIISETAINAYRKEEKKADKERQDNRLFNTKLIIYNYRELKAHCSTIPDTIVEFEDSIFDEEKLTLEVLMQERAKTYVMMEYIDLMWQAYKKHSERCDDLYKRRFNIVNSLFVSDDILTVSQLSEMYHLSIPLIYKDRNIGINNFSVFLFGLKSLRFKGS